MTLALHQCHATHCKVLVHPSLLMCIRHWRMVPRRLKHYLQESHRQGGESVEYLNIVKACIAHVEKMDSV